MQRTAKAACQVVLDDPSPLDVTLSDALTFADLFLTHPQSLPTLPSLHGTNADDVALILHSSGIHLAFRLLCRYQT